MRDERVSETEILAAIRSAGEAQLDKIGAVVLETDARLSIAKKPRKGEAASLRDISTGSTD
jgi:uncharacterized membrane protein YcaP (DUF421 family)